MKNLASILDDNAKTIASDLLKKEAELIPVLIDMKKNKIFIELNYSGIFDYCERALRMSRAQSYYYKCVVEKSFEVPEIKDAIVQGELTISETRRIVPVVTKSNFNEWKEKAKTLSQTELEREVTRVNPQARKKDRVKIISQDESELRTTFDKESEQDLKILQDLLSQKTKKAASIRETIKWALKECRQKHDPMLKKVLIKPAIDEKNESKNIENISNKPKAISSEYIGFPRAARISLGNRSPIPNSVKIQVYKKYHSQCAYTDPKDRRCQQRRWLDIHHLLEVSRCGTHELENLVLLCSGHHKKIHRSRN